MSKPSKCKNCQWYGKPYWSIINPCDSCPMENVETFTQLVDPTIEEKDKEIERLNKEKDDLDDYNRYLHNELKKKDNIIDELEKYIRHTSSGIITRDGIVDVNITGNLLKRIKELKEGKNEKL